MRYKQNVNAPCLVIPSSKATNISPIVSIFLKGFIVRMKIAYKSFRYSIWAPVKGLKSSKRYG